MRPFRAPAQQPRLQEGGNTRKVRAPGEQPSGLFSARTGKLQLAPVHSSRTISRMRVAQSGTPRRTASKSLWMPPSFARLGRGESARRAECGLGGQTAQNPTTPRLASGFPPISWTVRRLGGCPGRRGCHLRRWDPALPHRRAKAQAPSSSSPNRLSDTAPRDGARLL